MVVFGIILGVVISQVLCLLFLKGATKNIIDYDYYTDKEVKQNE